MSAQSSPQPNMSGQDESGWPELAAIAGAILSSAHASGVAIAQAESLKTGGYEIECCARSGFTAPEIGRSLAREDSLTAVCLRSGKQIALDDAANHAGLHGTAIVESGVRSLVLTPIRQEGRARGVLAVFANEPHGLSSAHLVQLGSCADQIAAILFQGLPKPVALAKKSGLVTHIEEEVKPELLTAGAPISRFATFEAVAGRGTWLNGKVILVSAIALLIGLGLAISAYWPSLADAAHQEAQNRRAGSLARSSEKAPDSSSGIESASLKVDPPTLVSRQGDTVSLSIVFSHGAEISSVPLQVSYDPLALRFESVSDGEFVSEDGRKATLLHRDDTANGIIKMNVQLPPGAAGFTGNATLCRLVFVAVQKASSTISVQASARNTQNQPVNVAGSQAQVSVN